MTRDEWRKQWDRCMACGSTWRLEVHEIARGPARRRALREPAAWLLLCHGCHHDEFDDYSVQPISRQLALKRKIDPDNYDREKVNALRGRAPGAISEADVDEWKDTV